MKKFIKNYLVKRAYQKVFSFYNSLSTIHLKALNLDKNEKILVLAPHADDEVIGCGGLLLTYSNQCDVIILTDGRYGDSQIEPDKMIQIRKDELSNVMDKIGIKNYSFLDIEDSMLQNSYEKFKTIDFNRYDYIFIPSNLDQHPDHKAVYSHIIKAYKEGKIDKNINLAMYEVWSALAVPNYYIDISNLAQRKKS